MKDVLLFFIGLVIGVAMGLFLPPDESALWRQAAIRKNCAYYDSKTGAFTWREGE